MPRTLSNATTIDDPELIEEVAIAIFEKTQGSWEYAREADREWLRLEAQAHITTFLKYVEARARILRPGDGRRQQSLLELMLRIDDIHQLLLGAKGDIRSLGVDVKQAAS